MSTALVTGGSSGLGLMIARRLQHAGYRVLTISRTQPPADMYDEWLNWDLSKPQQLTPQLLRSRLKDIDIFVGNAGMLGGLPPEAYNAIRINEVLQLHLTTQIILCNHLLQSMVERHFGRIVLIGSTAGDTGHPDLLYGATKAALANLAQSYAHLYGANGITVNCVQPGAMKTNITKDLPKRSRDFLSKHTVIAGPYLEVSQVADTVRQLVEPDNTLNGQVITLGANALWR